MGEPLHEVPVGEPLVRCPAHTQYVGMKTRTHIQISLSSSTSAAGGPFLARVGLVIPYLGGGGVSGMSGIYQERLG